MDAGAEADQVLRYLTVEIGPSGIAELDERRRVVFVPRDAITRVELCRGLSGERPVAQLVFALVFLGIALVAARIVIGWWRLGGTLNVEIVSGIAFLPLAPWLVWMAIRPAYYLRVETRDDIRKLVFRGRIDRRELERSVQRANRTFGYGIGTALPGFDLAGAPYR